MINMYAGMAWWAWGTAKAERCFSGPDAEELWARALIGKYPKGLGKPGISPQEAQRQVLEAVREKKLNYEIRKVPVDNGLVALLPQEAVKRFNDGEELWLSFKDVETVLRMSFDQILPYLQSGVLRAHAFPDGSVFIEAHHLTEFMATNDLPRGQA